MRMIKLALVSGWIFFGAVAVNAQQSEYNDSSIYSYLGRDYRFTVARLRLVEWDYLAFLYGVSSTAMFPIQHCGQLRASP